MLKEFVSSAHTLSGQTACVNLVSLNEHVLDSLRALLRQLLVEFCRTLWRSVTLNLNISLRMVLHVLSNQLYVSLLALVDNALTLAEEDSGLQVGCGSGLYVSGLLVALVKRLLQVGDLLVLGSQLRVLSVEVIAKAINLAVQAVNLSLVTQLSDSEVVSTVRVLELVDDTYIELNHRTVDGVVNAIVQSLATYLRGGSGQGPYHGRLDVCLPLLLAAKVESEVDTHLRGKIVCLALTESVCPAETSYGNHLEETRLALIATYPVAHVNGTQHAGVDEANGGAERLVRLVGEVSVALNRQTEHWSEVATDTQADVGVQTAQPAVFGSLRCNTSIDANVEIVKRFAFSYSLR